MKEGFYMKKLLALATTLLLNPFTALAISLSDIQNNPDQYVLVLRQPTVNTYVDSYSIASLRYDPPYYAMSGDVYLVEYNSNMIIKTNAITTYDATRSFKTLLLANHKAHPNVSGHDILVPTLEEMKKNDGITFHFGKTEVWNLDGNYISAMTNSEMDVLLGSSVNDQTMCAIGSSSYHAANYMFYKGYKKYFAPKFDSENLY